MKMRQKTIIAVLVVIGVLGIFYLASNKSQTEQPTQTVNSNIQEGWQQQTFNEAGLSLNFRIPPDTAFRKEMADDNGRVRVASFYVEKGPKDNPTYQLYVVYQPLQDATEQDIEKAKTGMDPTSIKEASIDGYNGIEGIANASDPKKHYSTVILKDRKLFSVSTWPPTTENKELTDKILTTFDFQ